LIHSPAIKLLKSPGGLPKVKLAEKIGFGKLGLKRIEIMMIRKNKASENVAAKCGYKKEGVVRKKLFLNNQYHDGYLYAKVIS
jgi:ribosomal-protein-alanine N-acetyltransferase